MISSPSSSPSSSSRQIGSWEKPTMTMSLPSTALVPLSVPLIATLKSAMEQEAAGFPFKLFEMLAQEDESVLSWQPHGRAFVVRDATRLAEDVLPRYFPRNKPVSFQRQLALYGFKRIASGRDAGAYYHEHFLQGRQDLLACLKRSKTTTSKDLVSSSEAPDFYKAAVMPAIQQALAAPTGTQPLRVPGRLLYQDCETPTYLRFAKTRGDAPRRRQLELRRWTQPLQPISTQLEFHDWSQKQTQEELEKASTKNESPRRKPTLNDIICLLE